MKCILTTIFVLLMFVPNSWANLYECTSPNAKPRELVESTKSELKISHMPPYIVSNELNVSNLDSKTPFLIYYAVDTDEAFMQISVRYEVAKLQQSCAKNPNVNFIIFLNSLYTKENSFLMCRNQIISYVNFNKYTAFNKTLIKKIDSFSGNDSENSIDNSDIKNKMFLKYPLAHPDFLNDLIKFATTEKRLFPNQNFAAFINLKSHGSNENVLAGLHPCQLEAKKLSANKIIRKLLTKSELKTIRQLNSPEKVGNHMAEYEKIISKLDLGPNPGIGSFNADPKLGEERLGQERLSEKFGLGDAVTALGVNEGLGSGHSFGTDHNHLTKILENLYKEGSNRSLAFLMLESCESSRNPSLHHNNLSNVFGYYTSKQSLWYRNLNWWDMLERADGRTVNLVNILQEETPKIPNIEVVNK